MSNHGDAADEPRVPPRGTRDGGDAGERMVTDFSPDMLDRLAELLSARIQPQVRDIRPLQVHSAAHTDEERREALLQRRIRDLRGPTGLQLPRSLAPRIPHLSSHSSL